ncbi:molybdopterin-dependent oxidoreductase [Candidatus Hecatella orcuttiae]|uniref:molybdopterin-containing oxidoreductase family protein n=1 Tax=Candidatus Hecatella orcuttiae TaxID=1935119 RepID=UPI0028682343|nr:molybdopterin-dependent oxidoreductase [Candidatus Hecatella orcuttiae]
MKRTVKTICQACHCECGVLVHVENERVVKIEGDPAFPLNRGFICVKGEKYSEFVEHLDRLKHPLKRVGERGGGKWRRISWDQALNEIAEKLTEIKEKYGSESIASIHGTGPRPTLYSTCLLVYALNSPNVGSVDLHICFAPSLIAENCTFGKSVMMEVGPDYENANCIVVWGGNPVVSHPPRGMEIIEAKQKRNVKLIVIDPRKTVLASQADLWLQVRPGTDVALALGMIYVILEEELYDKEFVEKWCHGFDALKEHLKQYPPERVADITWISAEKIKEAARIYATTKPAVLHHRVAVEHNLNSTQTNRALAVLIALTGNLDVKGGNLFSVNLEGYVGDELLLGVGKEARALRPDPSLEKRRIGSNVYPLTSGEEALLPFVNSLLLIDAILTSKPYPVKALFCGGGNPVINIQNSKKVWETLKKLELLVVVDFFMTPTAELADYVLPAAMWLERDDGCNLSYVNYIAARQKVIEPPSECWHDMKIVIELVKRIPWANRRFLPWNSVGEFNDWRVKGLGITFESFKKKGHIMTPLKYKKYESEGFKTPTGKVELYSTILEKYRYDPLLTYVEPPESPVGSPEFLEEYPLILITGSRHINYFHSEGRQIPSLRRLAPDPEIEIHPETATKMGIKDGDWVWVETPQVKGERVKFKAKLTAGIHPMVAHARHGWWFPEKPSPQHGCFESNINVITSDAPPREKICGSVRVRGTLCKVYKISSRSPQ